VLAGCGSSSGPSDEQQIRQVILDFAQATQSKDYKRICNQLLAPRLVEQTRNIGLPCEQAVEKALGSVRDPHVTVGKVVVKGDSASAQVRSSAAGQAPSQDTVGLTRVDGRWRLSSLGRP
jgi:ketosteroid isomerase-like protein